MFIHSLENKIIYENYYKINFFFIRLSILFLKMSNTESQNCAICQDHIFSDEFKTNCGHIFHGKCFNDYLRRSKNISCPICKKKNPITYNLIIDIYNLNIIEMEYQEIYYTSNEILNIAKEQVNHLKFGTNELKLNDSIYNEFTEKIYPLCFNNPIINVVIINSTIEDRVRLLHNIPKIDHDSFETFRANRFYDIDICSQKSFKILGYEKSKILSKNEYIKERIYNVWIIRETDQAYWIQFEIPFLIGKGGPKLHKRYYYIKKTGEITVLCSEQQILEISPVKNPKENSYCYSKTNSKKKRLLIEYNGYEFIMKKKIVMEQSFKTITHSLSDKYE